MVSTVLTIKTYIRVYNLFNSLRDVGITASERRRLRLWDIQERLSPPLPPKCCFGVVGVTLLGGLLCSGRLVMESDWVPGSLYF